MVRNKIFISHCTPNDNYFTAWLASKLKLLGYEVWVELDELKLGDAFWPEIEDAIRNQSIKFLTIISKEYIEKSRDPTSGIFKELSCADAIKNIINFKSPIRIENVSFNDFPVQIMGLHGIDFYGNWQEGLEKLLDSFKKENIVYDISKAESPINFWMDAFKIKDTTNRESETIYTNWFPFILPDKLYIHKPIIQNKIDQLDIFYPYIEYSDRHLCFFPKNDYPSNIECSLSSEFFINEILDEKAILVDNYITLIEPRKKIIELLNKVFKDHLIQKTLKRYEQSKGDVFYYKSTIENRKRINLKAVNKTNVSVAGKTKGNVWSYGISHFASLYPIPCFKISSHIIFENEDLVVLDQEEQGALRRSFAFDWYNRDWLDTLLGMMIKIANNDDLHIHIPINSLHSIEVSVVPFNIDTDFGYFEPAKEE